MSSYNHLELPKGTVVPNHIAIVLDGNGRWARSRGLPPTKGHEKAAKNLSKLVKASRDLGVHTLTLWAFSTENWKRPPKEVQKIFSLIRGYIRKELKDAKKEGVRFIHLGRKDRLSGNLLSLIKKAEEETRQNKKYILNLALDYGGRDEIIRAVKKIIEDKVPSQKIDESLFSSYLDTADQPYPDPDLFIRTSGEQRTSGLMPWQTVYSEFYFEDVHLPDFTPQHLKKAILDYSRRRRRFGAKDRVKHFTFKPELTAKFELAWWRLRKIPQGTRFRDYVLKHLKEQYGLSRRLAKQAAILMSQAVIRGEQKKWEEAKVALRKFYKLIKDELKLAFEPSLAASLEVKLWQDLSQKKTALEALDVEWTAREFFSEVYRISFLQAAKVAHLRILATLEKNLAEMGLGDYHWEKAEDYLRRFYKALKEKVA